MRGWALPAGFVAVLLLSCTFPARDPAAFEREAKHVERTYEAPVPALVSCMMAGDVPIPYWDLTQTPTRADFGLTNILRIHFETVAPNRTRVMAAGMIGLDPYTDPDHYFRILDGCAPRSPTPGP